MLQLHVAGVRAHVSFYEVILGIIIGALLGYSARKIMKFAERKKLIDRQSYVAQYVSLAILSIGKSAWSIHASANVKVSRLYSGVMICSLHSLAELHSHGMGSSTRIPKMQCFPTSLICSLIALHSSTLALSFHSPISIMPPLV